MSCGMSPTIIRSASARWPPISPKRPARRGTTLLTVMERLRAKGYLKRRKVDGRHHYWPTIAKAELLRGLVGDFVDDVLGGSVSPFVAYLARSKRLSDDEARRLAELVKRIESREQEDKP